MSRSSTSRSFASSHRTGDARAGGRSSHAERHGLRPGTDRTLAARLEREVALDRTASPRLAAARQGCVGHSLQLTLVRLRHLLGVVGTQARRTRLLCVVGYSVRRNRALYRVWTLFCRRASAWADVLRVDGSTCAHHIRTGQPTDQESAAPHDERYHGG